MVKPKHVFLILAVSLACGALAAMAAADNPHGTPPGQAKQDSTATAQTTPPGQANKDAATAANAQPVTADNSTGVKPSSTTQHSTSAAAGSNKTKLYGNGKTAGQIAMANGASASTTLLGPGNSQPHKVAVCSKGKTHYVDVHALKSHAAGACPAASASVSVSASTAVAATSGNGPATSGGTQANTAAAAAAAANTPAPVTVTPAAKVRVAPASVGTHVAVLGARKTLTPASAKHAASPAGVLAAKASKHVAAPAKAVVSAAHFTG